MPMELNQLSSHDALDEALKLPAALIYKHSSMCWSSFVAYRHVRRFAAGFREIPIFMVDVLSTRSVSDEIAKLLKVRHESPQIILVKGGVAVWDTSHYRITQDAIEQQLVR
jgi:bacillithiol system protein YtxJ